MKVDGINNTVILDIHATSKGTPDIGTIGSGTNTFDVITNNVGYEGSTGIDEEGRPFQDITWWRPLNLNFSCSNCSQTNIPLGYSFPHYISVSSSSASSSIIPLDENIYTSYAYNKKGNRDFVAHDSRTKGRLLVNIPMGTIINVDEPNYPLLYSAVISIVVFGILMGILIQWGLKNEYSWAHWMGGVKLVFPTKYYVQVQDNNMNNHRHRNKIDPKDFALNSAFATGTEMKTLSSNSNSPGVSSHSHSNSSSSHSESKMSSLKFFSSFLSFLFSPLTPPFTLTSLFF